MVIASEPNGVRERDERIFIKVEHALYNRELTAGYVSELTPTAVAKID